MDDRTKYIGGTDAAAILGVSRYKTQLNVWAEKTGKVVPEDISQVLAVKLGTRLEQTVAELFMEATGKKVHRVNETLYHPEYPFIGANLDRRVVGEDAILECKTCSPWKAKEWETEGEMPVEYIVQCMHYMAVTGKSKCYLAVLIGNQNFIWRELVRDNEASLNLIEKEVQFWQRNVLAGEFPECISYKDTEILNKLFNETVDDPVAMLPVEVNDLIDSLNHEKETLKQLKMSIEEGQNNIKAKLQEHVYGATDKFTVTWKPVSTTRIDSKLLKLENPVVYQQYSKTTDSKRLTIKEIK